jgi:hypothetical protein
MKLQNALSLIVPLFLVFNTLGFLATLFFFAITFKLIPPKIRNLQGKLN